MTIREAETGDLLKIREIYGTARAFMRAHGNQTQWGEGDGPEEKLEDDLLARQSFVGVDEQNEPHFVFAFLIGEDPTYQLIEDGAWLNQEPYGTIHRLGSDGSVHGVLAEASAFCEQQLIAQGIYNLRADTHADNKTMQKALERSGFVRVGIIYVSDGTPRYAYQKRLNQGKRQET